jgi:hypothetical protein
LNKFGRNQWQQKAVVEPAAWVLAGWILTCENIIFRISFCLKGVSIMVKKNSKYFKQNINYFRSQANS